VKDTGVTNDLPATLIVQEKLQQVESNQRGTWLPINKFGVAEVHTYLKNCRLSLSSHSQVKRSGLGRSMKSVGPPSAGSLHGDAQCGIIPESAYGGISQIRVSQLPAERLHSRHIKII